ncbi:Isocitrate/isopropylmalate dehydrogenase [Rhizoctonia solani]|uniref:Isocitrate/isopropylmalate dehydrogenase n=1 Tax=Rhizoctonia solani TaxID=456999 RepID=A0A8H8NPV0_9AGAM|nr:Isocitrate/isopropylmalate dehydrogenase [Rhizoctonia solani]QRW16518.1 Isocitrate/isopropylmalate dehydrogenase [Rhizoctonia solani]
MLRSAVTSATRSAVLRPTTTQVLRPATTLAAYYPKVARRLPTKYGGVYTYVTLIPGDGIGAEITDSVKEIFEHVNAPIEWEQYDVSGLSSAGEVLFKEAMESLKRNRVGLKGILYTPIDRSGHNSWNVAMRQQLDIYASVVLCKSIRGFPTRHNNVDFAIIRENTEGEYAGLEHQSYPGVVESLKVTTRNKSERIIRFAFDFALKNNRKAKEYKASGIQFNDMIVDNTSMQLVAKPGQFDVMVMPNLYGAIVSNIGAALVGGPGIVPGCNVGRANPAAMILSSTMMLRHLGLESLANSIAQSTFDVINEGKVRTADMGGTATTSDFTAAVIKGL